MSQSLKQVLKPALIGVDIGTTNIKAVAFSISGESVSYSSLPTPTHFPQDDWAEFKADEIWASICICLQDLIKQLPNDFEPAGISISSMAEAAFPLDADGLVISPAIAWFDKRVSPQLQWWQAVIGHEKTAEITGLNPTTAAGILRLLWLKDEQPTTYKAVSKWLNMSDFGIYKLSGATITDYSLASRMMTMNLQEKKWSDEILDKIEIDKSLFGELVNSGTKVGVVTSEAAQQTGLPQGLTVCSGGHDHICASMGLGIINNGQVFDSMGTAEVIMASITKPVLDKNIIELGIDQGCHVIPNRYYAITGLPFSGASLDWIRKSLSLSYEEFITIAADAQLGSGGVNYFSHLKESQQISHSPISSKAFIGANSETSNSELARAVMEGLVFEYHKIFGEVISAFSLTPTALVASGGSTRNTTLMNIKANVSGLPLVIPDVDEAACLGAALLAGIGAGIYKDFKDAKDQINYSSKLIEYDENIHQAYKKLYKESYLNIHEKFN